MHSVEEYIQQHEGFIQDILKYLHHWLSETMLLSPTIRYKIPFYDYKRWVCYLNVLPGKIGVELAFIRGNELSNINGVLQSKGRKQVMGIEFKSVQDISISTLHEIMQEALLLDEKIPYKIKSRNII